MLDSACFSQAPSERPLRVDDVAHMPEPPLVDDVAVRMQEPETRPVPYVYRRGKWVKASEARLNPMERAGIENPDGNGDTPTAWRLLPEAEYRGNIAWAEKKIEAASQLPTVSTLIAGFAVANLFEVDRSAFAGDARLAAYCFFLACTIGANLYISIVLSFLTAKGTSIVARDQREIDSGRYFGKRGSSANRAFVGAHGEHVCRAHAYVASNYSIIDFSTRLFLLSILSYVCAIGVFVVDQLPAPTAVVTVAPTLAGTVYLYRTLYAMGEFDIPGCSVDRTGSG